MAGMGKTELYVTWGLLFILAMGISSLGRAINTVHREIQELRAMIAYLSRQDSN